MRKSIWNLTIKKKQPKKSDYFIHFKTNKDTKVTSLLEKGLREVYLGKTYHVVKLNEDRKSLKYYEQTESSSKELYYKKKFEHAMVKILMLAEILQKRINAARRFRGKCDRKNKTKRKSPHLGIQTKLNAHISFN